jgi:exonuclease III
MANAPNSKALRIVSWNMNSRGVSAATHRRAWDYLRDELKADLALVQEAVPPKSLEQPVFESTGLTNYPWGTAVVSFRPDVTLQGRTRVKLADAFEKPVSKHKLLESHKGASAAADIARAGKTLFTAVSLYGQWEGMPGGSTYLAGPRVHRTLSDLTDVFRKARRSPVVLAGEFNVSTQGERSPDNEASAVFARLRGWQLADALALTSASRPRLKGCKCTDGNACTHVQTVNSGAQLDYAFVSSSVLQAMTACFVVQTKAASALSDHHPVVLGVGDPARCT